MSLEEKRAQFEKWAFEQSELEEGNERDDATGCYFDDQMELAWAAYQAGYDAGQPKWIDVKDRLPDYGGSYLIVVDGPTDTGDDYRGSMVGEFDPTIQEWCNLRGWSTNEVTHWMPLPEPPSK